MVTKRTNAAAREERIQLCSVTPAKFVIPEMIDAPFIMVRALLSDSCTGYRSLRAAVERAGA
jgi:hypothetical protein